MKTQEHKSRLQEMVCDRIRRSIELKQKLLQDEAFGALVIEAALQIVKALRAGGKVFFFGNGGSAADSQHLAAEFTGRYLKERTPWPAMALSVNTSSLTAIGNDYGFDLIFARQLQAFGRRGDVAIGITTSGNSPNVLRALELAKKNGIFAAAFSGGDGGAVKQLADCTVCVPARETPRIQECHILLGHIICEIVEEWLTS